MNPKATQALIDIIEEHGISFVLEHAMTACEVEAEMEVDEGDRSVAEELNRLGSRIAEVARLAARLEARRELALRGELVSEIARLMGTTRDEVELVRAKDEVSGWLASVAGRYEYRGTTAVEALSRLAAQCRKVEVSR